jgi:hypothetical protein
MKPNPALFFISKPLLWAFLFHTLIRPGHLLVMSKPMRVVKAGKFCKDQPKAICKSVAACIWVEGNSSLYCRSRRKDIDVMVMPPNTGRAANYAIKHEPGTTPKIIHLRNSPIYDSDSDSDGGVVVIPRIPRVKQEKKKTPIQVVYVQEQAAAREERKLSSRPFVPAISREVWI